MDCHAAGMVARRGEKATNFRGLVGCVGPEDGGGRVGLVKPRRCSVVLIEVTGSSLRMESMMMDWLTVSVLKDMLFVQRT